MDHYQAAAELVGLKEEDLIEKAIAESLEDAQALKMDADNLDAVLEANGLCRQRVPGEGDCQYLALMASAKAQGFNLGNLASVRILAFQGLMMNKDRYENAWMDEWGDYMAWFQEQLVDGTWEDDFTLQAAWAFVDKTVYGVRVYYAEADPTVEEWHYDAVVLPFQRSSQGKKRKSGFDLSGRRPKPESSGKHKYAIPEAKVAPEVDDDAERIDTATTLTDKDLIQAFYLHLEQDKTCRGKKFAPGAIQLFTRSFVVVLQVLLPKYLAGTNRSKKKILKKTVALDRAMGKTASEKRAMEGDDLPESSGQAGAEPMTFEEQAEKYKKWIQKEKALMKRIQKLPAETPQNELSYMKGLLVLNRTLHWSAEEDAYFFAPVGPTPRKTEKSARLSRAYFISRKFLSPEWSQNFKEFMKTYFPDLVAQAGLPSTGPPLTPPAREGRNEVAPFMAIPYDVFRKGVRSVTGTTSTDLRGAAEAYLLEDPAVTSRPHQARSLQKFVGNSEGTSLKHYHGHDARVLSKKLAKVINKKG
ncbi:unnamed protein product [Symbiodinium microadriaticum]|nr:unnamed protein product [Symbiodinium microadriaticum]CAE7505865.1 unnamed protein product [Symbiodinium sp. KB8]